MDKVIMRDYLVDSLKHWPTSKDVHNRAAPALDANWYWMIQVPGESVVAVNLASGESVICSEWKSSVAEVREQAIQWLVENVDQWPDFGDLGMACFLDTEITAPNLWEWHIDEQVSVLRQVKTGEVITRYNWEEAKAAKPENYSQVSRPEQYSNYQSEYRKPHIEMKCSVDTKKVRDNFKAIGDVPGYEKLREVLEAAYDQAARGKGKERHAKDLPFHEQRMQTISQLIDSERGMAYQICKKVVEGLDLPTPEARRRELLGAINYIAGVLIYWEQAENGESNDC